MDPRVKFPFLLLSALLAVGLHANQDPPATSRSAAPDSAEVETSLLLLGDAGAARPDGDPILHAVTGTVNQHPDRTVTLFLGDNVYPDGLPADGHGRRSEAERRLQAQVEAGQAAQRLIFIPGNHDWTQTGRASDWEAVRRQSELLSASGVAELRPTAGCPGPEALDVGEHLRLVFLDTEWWLHELPPPLPSLGCSASTAEEVARGVAHAIGGAGERHVVIAGHHPPVSAGPHGGHFDAIDHVFPLRAVRPWMWIPLPLVGSIYPLGRHMGASIQDQSHGAYRRMVGALRGAIEPHRPLLFAAGHEHQLGVFTGGSIGARYVVVSGAGITGHERGAVGKSKETLFATRRPGFIRLDLLRDGRVRLTVSALTADGAVDDVHEQWLR